jgi:hypothetical protein
MRLTCLKAPSAQMTYLPPLVNDGRLVGAEFPHGDNRSPDEIYLIEIPALFRSRKPTDIWRAGVLLATAETLMEIEHDHKNAIRVSDSDSRNDGRHGLAFAR